MYLVHVSFSGCLYFFLNLDKLSVKIRNYWSEVFSHHTKNKIRDRSTVVYQTIRDALSKLLHVIAQLSQPTLFVWLISHGKTYCWLICCERKTLLPLFYQQKLKYVTYAMQQKL
jgi:hypothetical protein